MLLPNNKPSTGSKAHHRVAVSCGPRIFARWIFDPLPYERADSATHPPPHKTTLVSTSGDSTHQDPAPHSSVLNKARNRSVGVWTLAVVITRASFHGFHGFFQDGSCFPGNLPTPPEIPRAQTAQEGAFLAQQATAPSEPWDLKSRPNLSERALQCSI